MRRNTVTQALALLALILPVPLLAQGQTQQSGPKPTVIANNKYGEGGTLETYSDNKLRLEREIWKDKNGVIREVHVLPSETSNLQFWTLFSRNGRNGNEYIYNPSTKTLEVSDVVNVPQEGSKPAYTISVRNREEKGWDQSRFDKLIEDLEKTIASADKAAAEREARGSDDLDKPPPLAPTQKEPLKAKPEPKPKPKVVAGLDPCIVGRWRSERTGQGYFSVYFFDINNEGIVLEVRADGSASFDYSEVQPLVQTGQLGNDEVKVTTTITGKTVASEIFTEYGSLGLAGKGSVSSNVKITETRTDGTKPRIAEAEPQSAKLLFDNNSVGYKCEEKTQEKTLKLEYGAIKLQFRNIE